MPSFKLAKLTLLMFLMIWGLGSGASRAGEGAPPQSSASAPVPKPILKDPAAARAREAFHALCDYIVAEKKDVAEIFTGGYYMRDLVAGYRIFGERRYLDAAIAYADGLLKKQSARGYWETGYGRLYLADTGSALGLFIVLYPHVDPERRRQYLASVQRYTAAIERDGLIRPTGALDVGMRLDAQGNATVPYDQDYTISSALTGGEVYTWLYHVTKEERPREVAWRALRWIFSTMRVDGVIPYNHPSGKSDLRKRGDKINDYNLWEHSLYLTSAYVGEGLLSFDRYCARPEWQREFRAAIRPHIDYVLRHQNPNGTWAVDGPWDQKRSPGVINLLTWYYQQVEPDPRIPAALGRFLDYILVPENAKAFGMLNAGAAPAPKDRIAYDCVTGLTGRVLADLIQPGIDADW